MRLPQLYHWSPVSRRAAIELDGLIPGCEPTVGTVSTVTNGRHMICFGTSPSAAWGLSGNTVLPGVWDLWQVNLAATDEVHVLPMFGDLISEVRVANAIPPSRLWWIGQRDEGGV